MKTTSYIIGLLIILTIVSCDNSDKTKHPDKGRVTIDIRKLEFDSDLLRAIQAIGKDSLEKKQLWSRTSETTIYTDNFTETNEGLTDNIIVKQSHDSLFIKYRQNSVDEEGNIALAGFSYEIIVCNSEYMFIDDSWSDVIYSGREEKIEYSPFYLNNSGYQIGDTIIGCFAIKKTQYDENNLSMTTYLKFAINTIVRE